MTEFENAIAELRRSTWTALNVLGEHTDWVTKDDVEHMKSCPLKNIYTELNTAAIKVEIEWFKIKKKLGDKAFQRLIESLEEV